MRIRKLELQGFKSFVDRQTFHFGSGIAGVVGPNGCGKSNVVDAVKWCIGEQSAKSLRGAAMADVIFNGSASRPPVGMAEVCLTFAADDEPFSGKWARFEEIAISRRLFRDGASEYRINQERVRLRDVHDLFLDTGVGTQLYSFIEQGRVDRIVLSRPEQRRTLIEEAAGISRYKARRSEALDKLEQTRTNLDRVCQVADDMQARLRSLERQVVKAARYRLLRATVRQGELLLGLARYAGLSEDRRALAGELRQARTVEETTRRTLAAREDGLGGLRDSIAVADVLAGELRDHFAELEAQRRESESARRYQAREREALLERLARLETQVVEHAAQLDLAQAEAERFGADLARWQAAVRGQHDALGVAQAEAQQARGALVDLRAAVDQDKAAITALLTQATRVRAALAANARAQEDLQERRGRAQAGDAASRSDLDTLREALAGAQAGLETADAAVSAASATRESDRLGVQASRTAVGEAQTALRTAERAHTAAQGSVAGAEARLASLQALLDAHEGVPGGARELLELPGVLGTLAEHLDVPHDQLDLLQAALGDALEHVLVQDHDALLAAARCATGRVGLITVADAPAPSALAQRFSGTPAGQAAVARLLASSAQAPDLVQALKAHAGGAGAVVAGDGSRIDASGVVWVGSAGSSPGQVILQRRQALRASTAALAQERRLLTQAGVGAEQAESALETTHQAQAAAVSQAERSDRAFRQAQLAQAEARQRLRHGTQALDHAQARARELAAERDRLQTGAASLAAEAGQARLLLSELEERQASAETALQQRQAGLQAHEERDTDARDTQARVRAERDGGQRQVQLLQVSLTSATERRDDAARRLAQSRDETQTSQARIAVLGTEDKALAATIARLGAEQGQVRTRLEDARTRLAADRDKLAQAELGLRGLRERREKYTAARTRLEQRIGEVKHQIETIKTQVEQRHEVSLPGMLDRLDRRAALILPAGDGPVADLPESLGELDVAQDLRLTPALLEDRGFIEGWVTQLATSREQLRRIGEVNLTALDEYTEVQARWSWLDEQRADLTRSTETIRRAIADINRTCRTRFRDSFDRVDKAFRTLYPELVGGGEAHLSLTDEDDLLETGVEIYARPPGKRMQSLRLLSGGEKAMTAIALIFAIFKVRPSPFCMLDEVDAPLDEGNGARFNDLLRQMSDLSQFIVVTHNKKTMAAVDTLYGVTMPEPGTSRLVTVRLT